MKELLAADRQGATAAHQIILSQFREAFSPARDCAEATEEHLDWSLLAFKWHVKSTPDEIELSDGQYVGVSRGAPVDDKVVSCFGSVLKSHWVVKAKGQSFVSYDGAFIYKYPVGAYPTEHTDVAALQR